MLPASMCFVFGLMGERQVNSYNTLVGAARVGAARVDVPMSPPPIIGAPNPPYADGAPNPPYPPIIGAPTVVPSVVTGAACMMGCGATVVVTGICCMMG